MILGRARGRAEVQPPEDNRGEETPGISGARRDNRWQLIEKRLERRATNRLSAQSSAIINHKVRSKREGSEGRGCSPHIVEREHEGRRLQRGISTQRRDGHNWGAGRGGQELEEVVN